MLYMVRSLYYPTFLARRGIASTDSMLTAWEGRSLCYFTNCLGGEEPLLFCKQPGRGIPFDDRQQPGRGRAFAYSILIASLEPPLSIRSLCA